MAELVIFVIGCIGGAIAGYVVGHNEREGLRTALAETTARAAALEARAKRAAALEARAKMVAEDAATAIAEAGIADLEDDRKARHPGSGRRAEPGAFGDEVEVQ